MRFNGVFFDILVHSAGMKLFVSLNRSLWEGMLQDNEMSAAAAVLRSSRVKFIKLIHRVVKLLHFLLCGMCGISKTSAAFFFFFSFLFIKRIKNLE